MKLKEKDLWLSYFTNYFINAASICSQPFYLLQSHDLERGFFLLISLHKIAQTLSDGLGDACEDSTLNWATDCQMDMGLDCNVGHSNTCINILL